MNPVLMNYRSIVSLLALLVAAFFYPEVLLAVPVVFGTVAGDGDDAGDGGDGGDPDDAGDGGDGDDAGEGEGSDEDEEEAGASAGNRGARARGGNQGDDGRGRGRNDEFIPRHRFNEVNQRFTAAQRENERLRRAVAAVLGGDGTGRDANGDPVLTPRQRQLRDEFLNLFPEFRNVLKLAPKADDVLGLTERVPAREAEDERYWTRVARTTERNLIAHVAKELKVQKLDAETRADVLDSFIAWVKRDKTGDREARYEEQDPSLINDFWAARMQILRGPQRSADADALRRGTRTRALPRGGQGSSHIPGQPKKREDPNADPFDEAGTEAWTRLQDQIAAGG